VKGPLDPGPVVIAELSDTLHDPLQIGVGHFLVAQPERLSREACFRGAAQVHHDLKQLAGARMLVQRALDTFR
jgi:hypothetical protein